MARRRTSRRDGTPPWNRRLPDWLLAAGGHVVPPGTTNLDDALEGARHRLVAAELYEVIEGI
jgi:hypothetical protein